MKREARGPFELPVNQNTVRKIVLACISQPYTPRAWAKAASAIAS